MCLINLKSNSGYVIKSPSVVVFLVDLLDCVPETVKVLVLGRIYYLKNKKKTVKKLLTVRW